MSALLALQIFETKVELVNFGDVLIYPTLHISPMNSAKMLTTAP